MKYFRFLGIVIITMLMTIPVFAKRSILFKGDWCRMTKSLENDLPIHACVEDSNEELSLSFDKDLGTVYITVTDSFGNQLYYQSLEIKDETSLVIPINGNKGEYILSITDGRNIICSQFSIY